MKTTYSCDYCGETFLTKSRCFHHEYDCEYNPKNKTCTTCKNWYFDVSAGMIMDDGEPEGEPKCKLPEFEPFNRTCDGWVDY